MHVVLPLGTALLLNGYWPLQLIMYGVVHSRTANPRPLTAKLVKGYMIIGMLAGNHDSCTSASPTYALQLSSAPSAVR